MPHYRVEPDRSRLVVRARSSIHDTETTWRAITGTIDADPATLETAGAAASFTVDMASFDAGDWLKNRKLASTIDAARHPRAVFELGELTDVRRGPDGSFTAVARGVVRWRGRQVEIEVAGQGTLGADTLEARGSFELDIRTLGVEPPRFLVFQVQSEVTVEVTLHARVG